MQIAYLQENIVALANIFTNLVDILSMVIGSQAILVFILFLFMRKWKLSVAAFLTGVALWTLASCMDVISPGIREFAIINNDSEAPFKATIFIVCVVLLLTVFLASLMMPIVIGKIRKKALLPIIGLFLMNFLIPVLYPFAMWLALKEDAPQDQTPQK